MIASIIMGSLNNTSGKSALGSEIYFFSIIYLLLGFFGLASWPQQRFMRFRVDADFTIGPVKKRI